MNVLVTGGLGFIGSHLCDQLWQDGHSVTVIDNRSNNARVGEHICADICHFLVRPDLKAMDCVFHLAAVSRTPPAVSDPLRCHEVNATGTLHLLEKCRRECPDARIVVASSNVVYGAWTAYKASKLAAENYVSVYNELYGMNSIALRFANTYGPHMRWDDVACFASLRRSMVEKGYLEITGDGEQSRDWVHVQDIVAGCLAAARSEFRGVLDLCSGVNHTMNEVAKFFPCPVRYGPKRIGDIEHIVQSPREAEAILGWTAKVKLAGGIQDVIRGRGSNIGLLVRKSWFAGTPGAE